MADPRLAKLAHLLVAYSVELKPGQQVVLMTHPLAHSLTLAVYEEAIKAGANVFVRQEVPGAEELFYTYALDAQLDYVSPVSRLIFETFDAMISLWAEHNTRELSAIDGARIARASRAGAPLTKLIMERSARKEFSWVLTASPTQAMAQDAEMSLREYEDFVFGAGMLHLDDPTAFWRDLGRRQQVAIDWLNGKRRLVARGSNVDLSCSIEGRVFVNCDGKVNFPDGEIFTGPVEDSVNGWIRYRYPAIYSGQEVTDIELWFENGKVVKERASKNQELLSSMLNVDAGARYLGEFGIGTNDGIQRFTKNMLFDEKMGGTIHLAVGAGYPESGSKNESGIHWDMLCDTHDAELSADGEVFYKDGKLIVS